MLLSERTFFLERCERGGGEVWGRKFLFSLLLSQLAVVALASLALNVVTKREVSCEARLFHFFPAKLPLDWTEEAKEERRTSHYQPRACAGGSISWLKVDDVISIVTFIEIFHAFWINNKTCFRWQILFRTVNPDLRSAVSRVSQEVCLILVVVIVGLASSQVQILID